MPSGAVFTMVRISGIDPTRPAREMQSGIRCRCALACSCTIATQHEQQQPPSSYRRERHATGVDGKLPRELLGSTLHCQQPCRSEEHTSELQSLMRLSSAV